MTIQNKAILIGHLGNDMEIRYVQNGKGKAASFRLATDSSYKNRETGEWVNQADWHRVVTYQTGLIDALANKMIKGSLVAVEGLIKTRTFTDSLGVEKYITEIIVDSRGAIKLLERRNVEETPAGSSEDHYHHDAPYGDYDGGDHDDGNHARNDKDHQA